MSPHALRAEAPDAGPQEPIAICGMACRLPGGVNSDSSFWQMLVEKRTGQTAKVPATRFNIDAHLHENLERPGSFNVPGGYFLDGRPEDFDPTFFNITPVEAQWLDPQQRKMLEVTFECLTSAGLTLESVSGTNTAVFVGSFTSDYQQMSTREPDFRHNYAATGVDPGLISARIGNAFNLSGPSFTINTACSSSVYAMHNACNGLRAGDCDGAVVGGVNLILTVDQHMNTAKLGILSPTSTCHTFDASADGYGRAEGVGAVYLKRLSDAVRDGNPIRGVIRATAVNTNGKVPGMGITHPSVEGQERVVRTAYEKSQLDPSLTAYAELHGTGTPVGDPIEVRAISRALNDKRSPAKPLLVGAVKPNIGHSEAASGIFAVMKAALMTEAAVIPGVALLEKLNPEIHENDWNVKVTKDTMSWPSDLAVRRASVSSFGYGGTNGHVVIEAVESLYPNYRHGQPKRKAEYDHSTERPMLVCMSAHDKKALSRVVSDIAAVAPEYYGIDLAHTLNLHRTAFSHRTFTILREGQETTAFDNAAVMQSAGTTRKTAPRLAFLFTGQGAQWAGVGRVAMAEFPVFADVIHSLDRVLRRVKPAPSFKLAELLLRDPAETAKIMSEPSVAQPLCTAIQLALVDLFAQWNIEPAVSVGHSSGEIAAAYAAGLVSAPEAMLAAYCRGVAVQSHSGAGAMMAVGLGRDEVEPYLPEDPADVCIACENSPQSVTLSGRGDAVARLREALSAMGVFAREVGTGRAYHSPHMAAVATAYEAMLEEALEGLSDDQRFALRPRSAMVSSVTGKLMDDDELPAGYFSQNLRQRVRFDEAVRALGADEAFADVNVALEIGPHSALAGPFRQICKAAALDRFSYVASLVRQKNDADQLLSAAGALFVAGYPLSLAEVNAPAYEGHGRPGLRKGRTQYLLVDLPPYPWQYEREYWAEPRPSAEQRALAYPRHDLLGGRVSGLSAATRAWRNVLRVRDVPWLHEHRLGGTAIFPAAGYLAMAIEAVRQVHETDAAEADEGSEEPGPQRAPLQGVTLRDVEIKAPLSIPDREEEGVETLLTLKPAEAPGWHAFTVESCAEQGGWTTHCQGTVRAETGPAEALSTRQARVPVNEAALGQHVPGRRWYDAFARVGFEYGPAFQQLAHAQTERGVPQAAGAVTVRAASDRVAGESRALVHPVTIDACLHLVIISVHAGRHREMPWGVVPTHIDEVAVAVPAPEDAAAAPGRAFAWTDGRDGRSFNTHAQLLSQSRRTLVDIKNLTCVAYEAAVPVSAGGEAPPAPFSTALWKPDLARDPAGITASLLSDAKTGDGLAKLVGLVAHRQPVTNVLMVGTPSPAILDATLEQVPSHAAVKLGVVGDAVPVFSEKTQGCVSVASLGADVEDWPSDLDGETFDLVVVEGLEAKQLLPLVNDEGWVLRKADANASYSALQKTDEEPLSNGDTHPAITLVSFSDATKPWEGLARALEATGSTVTQTTLVDFQGDADSHVVVDDTNGQFFSCLDVKSFDGLKRLFAAGGRLLWLTRGVQQGQSMVGGMAAGFLRVLCSEMAAARVVLLDYGEDESLEALGRAAVDLVARADTRDSGRDNEFWLDRGLLHISRLVPDDGPNADFDEEARLARLETKPLPDPEEQVMKVRMLDGDVGVEPVEPVRVLAPDEVEMRVDASQEPSTGQSGLFVVGNIVQVGSAVAETVIGQRAVGYVTGELTTLARTSVFATTQLGVEGPSLSEESLLDALAPLPPMVDLVLGKTQLQSGHPLVALPGPPAAMAALAQIARAQGWDLSVVATTPEEREQYEALSAYGRLHVLAGDDVEALGRRLEAQAELGYAATVLAHGFGHLGREIWRLLPASGRFLLLNTESAPVVPDATPFARGASFVSTPASFPPTSSLLARCLRQIEQHRGLVATQALIPVAEEKPPVVSLHPGESKFKMVPPTNTCRLSGDAVYLLVGCLGGLGRSLTKRMMELGARHFAFISRSGADKPEAAAVVEGITAAGATAQVFRADASDETAARGVVAQVAAERPLRGVVHAAMVLRDGMFERMAHEAFEAALAPKARGAVALHRALQAVPGLELDFFVLTSSISALLGNTGQSNYAAANGALESLARFRVARGLPATALVLPMVLDVGVVAEADGLEESLLRKGLYGIDEHEMLRGVERAMGSRGTGAPLVLGMEAAALGRTLAAAPADSLDLYWYRDARFCHVRRAIEAAGRGGAGSGGGGLAEALQAAQAEGGQAAVLRTIAAHVAKRVSIILMIAVEDIELEGPSIASYGLDSMIGAEMRTWLFKEFSLDYPFQQLLAPDLTFTKLAKVIAEKMGVL